MLNSAYLQYLQASGITNILTDTDVILYEQYKRGVLQFLHENTGQATMSAWTEDRQKKHKETLIEKYIYDNPRKVKGYFRGNTIDIQSLLGDIRRDIVLEGILTEALDEESINEIQINHWDGAIFIEQGGKYVPYINKEGARYRFTSSAELEALMAAMVDSGDGSSQRATVGQALINTKTARSYYRVSITHESVVTRDLPPYDQPSMSVTIRKFKRTQLVLEDLVRSEAMSKDMALLTSYAGAFDGNLLAIGATASGKTTLLGMIARTVPDWIRVILCQNPTEITLIKRSVDGLIVNNALHWESKTPSPDEKITAEYPTLANEISHALRNSPQLLIVGEMRAPEEFEQGFRAIITGHRFMSSLHAASAEEACERCVAELASCGGNISDAALRKKVAMSIDLIFTQKKLGDGARKIMAITELTGKVDEYGYPILNVIYEFKYDQKTTYNEDGTINKIYGHHQRVGSLTSRILDKFYAAGFDADDLKLFVGDVDKDYKEVYECLDGEFDLTTRRKAKALRQVRVKED